MKTTDTSSIPEITAQNQSIESAPSKKPSAKASIAKPSTKKEASKKDASVKETPKKVRPKKETPATPAQETPVTPVKERSTTRAAENRRKNTNAKAANVAKVAKAVKEEPVERANETAKTAPKGRQGRPPASPKGEKPVGKQTPSQTLAQTLDTAPNIPEIVSKPVRKVGRPQKVTPKSTPKTSQDTVDTVVTDTSIPTVSVKAVVANNDMKSPASGARQAKPKKPVGRPPQARNQNVQLKQAPSQMPPQLSIEGNAAMAALPESPKVQPEALPALLDAPEEGAIQAGQAGQATQRSRRRRGGRKRNNKSMPSIALGDEANAMAADNGDNTSDASNRDAVGSVSLLESSTPLDGDTTNEAVPAAQGASNRGRPKKQGRPAGAKASQAEGKKVAEVNEETEITESTVPKQMLISILPDEQAEVVIVEEGKVTEYYIEMAHHAKIRGNIYKGVISNIDTNLQAAFVNYGHNKNGFLQIDEVHPEYWLQHHEPAKGHKHPPIQKVLKAGQEVMVQVVKEPNGTKGAFLTTWVSLAGRFLVLTPGQEQIGISRKVEDESERNRLRELIRGIEPGPGLGAIVRTVSAGTSKTTLQKDLNFLKRLWKDILKKVTTESAPALIYQEPNLATRAIRDYLSESIDAVWVDDAGTMDSIRSMVQLLFPRKTKLVHLYKGTGTSLWTHFKVQKQLDQVYSREVVMPAGGRLVFDQTEALMAIDINSGKTSGKSNFESMALRTNTEAAIAIAQQLRLRDIGGQVVIDFIEMRDQAQCRAVEKALRNAMKYDRARHDIGKMSDFGLLQLVRQRIGSSAISISQEPCPCCNGTGMRRNMEWQSLRVLKDISAQARQAAGKLLKETSCTVERELGLYLLNHKRQRLLDLEAETGVHIHIVL